MKKWDRARILNITTQCGAVLVELLAGIPVDAIPIIAFCAGTVLVGHDDKLAHPS